MKGEMRRAVDGWSWMRLDGPGAVERGAAGRREKKGVMDDSERKRRNDN